MIYLPPAAVPFTSRRRRRAHNVPGLTVVFRLCEQQSDVCGVTLGASLLLLLIEERNCLVLMIVHSRACRYTYYIIQALAAIRTYSNYYVRWTDRTVAVNN